MASVAPPSPPREPDRSAMKESWVEDLEKAENRLQDNASKVRNEIKAFFHYCREKLDARERQLMTQLDDNCQKIASYLNVQRTKLLATESPSKRGLFSISEADLELSSKYADNFENEEQEEGSYQEDDVTRVNGSADGTDENKGPNCIKDLPLQSPHRKKHLIKKIKNSPEINLSQADNEARKKFTDMVNNLGLVYAGKADPSRTVACCRPALVKARCTGKIKAIDKYGKECRKGRDDIVAFLEAPSGNISKCNIIDCRNGTYNVNFVPNELGKHKLHVKVSGVPLKPGPLEVHARFVRVHVKNAFLGGPCIFALEIPSDYELNWKSDDSSSECATTLTPQMLGIRVRDPDNKETRCTIIGCIEKMMGVAKHNVRFFPLKPGDHEISVSLHDGPILLQQIVPVQEREQIGSRGCDVGQMFSPTDIAITQNGDIFVADTVENARIQQFATNGAYVSCFPVEYQEPSILAVDQQHVVVLFQGCMKVFVYTYDGSKAGSFSVENLSQPTDMAITSTGHIAVIDRQLSILRLFSKKGKTELQVGKEGTKPGEFKEPYYICVTSDDHIFVSEHGNHRVQEINSKGTYIKDLRSKDKMSEPGAVAITSGGHLLVYDEKDKKVQIVNLDENRFSGSLTIDLLEPRTARIGATPDGFLVALDMINNCLWRYRIPFEY